MSEAAFFIVLILAAVLVIFGLTSLIWAMLFGGEQIR